MIMYQIIVFICAVGTVQCNADTAVSIIHAGPVLTVQECETIVQDAVRTTEDWRRAMIVYHCKPVIVEKV